MDLVELLFLVVILEISNSCRSQLDAELDVPKFYTYGGAAQLEVGLPYATQPTRVHTYGGAAQLDSGLTS